MVGTIEQYLNKIVLVKGSRCRKPTEGTIRLGKKYYYFCTDSEDYKPWGGDTDQIDENYKYSASILNIGNPDLVKIACGITDIQLANSEITYELWQDKELDKFPE